MRSQVLIALSCFVVGGLELAVTKAQEKAEEPMTKFFEPHEFTVKDVGALKYRLLKPADFSQNQTYPLVIFLHGAGERGDDNVAQLVHGMKDFLNPDRRKNYPCFVVAPQCPNDKKWVEVDWSAKSHDQPEHASVPMQLVHDLIKEMIKNANVNKDRIYITGLSMGGYGTWDAIARYPELFAAAVPICGGGDPATVGKFAKLPIWCFHGDQDEAVSVERSRKMIDALKVAGGQPKYTEYAGVGHDSWTATYANPDFHDWLFAQERLKPVIPANSK